MAETVEDFKSSYIFVTQKMDQAMYIVMAFTKVPYIFNNFKDKTDDEKKQMFAFIRATPATIDTEKYPKMKENQKKAMRDGVNLLNWYINDAIDTIEYQMRQANGGRARRRSAKSRSKSRRRK